MTTYSLTTVNNSQMPSSFAIFQTPPTMTIPGNVFSLAWFAHPTAISSKATFSSNLDYSYVWSETGMLQPSIGSSASQSLAADPNGQNFVQLTRESLGAPTPAENGATDPMTDQQMTNVVPNQTSVGIGMSSSGTFAVQAAPNMTAVFTPHPNYWVVFGNYQTGDVMDIENIASAVEVSGGD